MPSFNGYAPPFPGAGGSPDPVTLGNLTPAGGSDLGVTQAITFELTYTPPASIGPSGLGRVIIWVEYPSLNGLTEVVYNGERFTSAFDSNSLTAEISASIRKFTVKRNGGWPSRPTIYVHANTDDGGLNS